MGYKCSAIGCKTGYRSSDPIDSEGNRITLHQFPLSNKDLLYEWVKAVSRKNYIPTKSARLCSLHFTINDYIYTSRDKDINRLKRKEKMGQSIEAKHLKEDAVPTIFTHAGNYKSTKKVHRDSAWGFKGTPSHKKSKDSKLTTPFKKSAAKSRRREGANMSVVKIEGVRLEIERNSSFFSINIIDNGNESSMDDVEVIDLFENLNIDQIYKQLKSQNLPLGFLMNVIDETLLIYQVDVTSVFPTIKSSIKIDRDKNVQVTINDKLIDISEFNDIISSSTIEKISEIVSIMARVKILGLF